MGDAGGLDAARDALARMIVRDFDGYLAGLARRPVPRDALIFFETIVVGLLSADEHVDRRRRLEAAVLALADDRTLQPRVRKRVLKLLKTIQDGA
jgi:hypothetical protein